MTPARAGGAGAAWSPFPGVLPLNLKRDEAAWFLRVSTGTFDAMVEAGEMPKPFHWRKLAFWRRSEIEEANARLGARDEESRPDSWADV